MDIYSINSKLDIPLYKQLFDSISSSIKTGKLSPGTRLLTVQKLTEGLGVARGTVKRAYDELERAGLIEKIQGRGTFVCYQPANSGSHKEQAMAAIDTMLEKLEAMGFSSSEINIFLDLKLRERARQEAHIRVAVVECNTENLARMSDQLRHIPGVDLYSYLMESISQYPYKLSEDFDLVVTTSAHADSIESAIPPKSKLVRVALRPSASCLSAIIKQKKGSRLGIIGYSRRFADFMHDSCLLYCEDVDISRPFFPLSDSDTAGYLKGKNTIIVPKDYEKYFPKEVASLIHGFRGEVIECYYEMDEGSTLYLETKIKRLLADKSPDSRSII